MVHNPLLVVLAASPPPVPTKKETIRTCYVMVRYEELLTLFGICQHSVAPKGVALMS